MVRVATVPTGRQGRRPRQFPMKILFVATECVPFCKTGGLADVIGALPKELRKRRHDVRIILPKYRTIRGQEFGIKEAHEQVHIPIGNRIETGDIRMTKTDKKIPVYFIHHEGYFGRSGIYRTSAGDYPDNDERFLFFCRAVLEACKAMEFRPDVIHLNDWQTGLIPVYLKTFYQRDSFFQHTRSVMTIHNIAYQGIFPKTVMDLAHLDWADFIPEKLEFYDQVNFLKAGLVYADVLTTVSPTYAQQIKSGYDYGRGLEGILQHRSQDLKGILNGLDVEEWNPAKDLFLARPFDSTTLNTRVENKIALQQACHLPVNPDIPVLGLVARFDPQKGVDLLADIVPDLLKRKTQIIVLGQGDLVLQARLEMLEKDYPDSFRIRSDFNEPLAHQIYGGCDLFLMPSRFEPCGLGQLIAMRYGAIPVAANTGGLRDTISPVTPETGTGFLFQMGSAPAFLGAIQEALHWWSDKARWSAIQKRAMNSDFSWDAAVESYLQLYRTVLGRSPQLRERAKRRS